MYRILIADDEGIMVESLKTIITSSFGDECEIACAKTGRAVVEQAESFRPDIALVDIQMPGLNGIQAIKEVRKFNQNTIFIIISAYDKFHYAQEAINLGVLEYLMKPVNKKKILEVCTKAMQLVDETRKKRSDDLKIREKLEIVVPVIESGYIYNLLLLDEFHTYQSNYQVLLNITQEYAFMVVVEFGDSVENGVLTNAVGASVKANKFYTEFREIAKSFLDCLVGPVMGNRIILLVPYQTGSVEYEERVEILTRMRNMLHRLENRIDCKFRGGIGRVKSWENVKDSYTEALRALREGDSHVVHINDIPIVKDYDGEYPLELENRFLQRAMEPDYAGAMDTANRFFEWMLEHYQEYREDIEIKVLELVMRIEHTAFFKGGVKYGFRYRENYWKEIHGCRDYEELRNWFLEKTAHVCQGMATTKEKESESVVAKARNYIDENYNKDISLDEVSRMVDISPYYFSKLFKQEQGEGFVEYLTRIRMTNARQLLKNQKYSIKEICSMCGYSDPNYFSRIFKRYEGVTPSEFRERLG